MASLTKPKQLFWMILKFGLSFSLVFYLVKSGNLDFRQLMIIVEKPWIFAVIFAQWFVVILCLCGLRWWILLKGQELIVDPIRTFKLHLTGLFFNSVMPGAVSGDVIKAMYVVRDQQSRKTPAMLTIVLDRIVGLMGLFLIGALSVLGHFEELWTNVLLRPVVVVVLMSLLASVILYVVALMPIREERDPFVKIFSISIPGFSLLKKIYLGLRSYRKHPMALIGALLISVITQGINMLYFVFIAQVFTNQELNFSQLGLVYPIGALVTALPLAPGGLGAGHAAFEKLFSMVGIAEGANIFNVFFVGTWILNMLGAIPYSFLGKKNSPQETVGNSALNEDSLESVR